MVKYTDGVYSQSNIGINHWHPSNICIHMGFAHLGPLILNPHAVAQQGFVLPKRGVKTCCPQLLKNFLKTLSYESLTIYLR